SGLELGLGEQCIVRGREHLDESARLRPVDIVRHRQHVRLVDGDELGMPAAGKERHHAVASFGLAGALEPGDVRRRAGGCLIVAETLEQVGAVDAGCANADQDLAWVRNRVGALLDLEPPIDDYRCPHARMLRACNSKASITSRASPATHRPTWSSTRATSGCA